MTNKHNEKYSKELMSEIKVLLRAYNLFNGYSNNDKA